MKTGTFTKVVSREQVALRMSSLLAAMGFVWQPVDGFHVHVFDDLGFDSFDGWECVAMVCDEFGFSVDVEDFDTTFTLGEIVDAVTRRLNES